MTSAGIAPLKACCLLLLGLQTGLLANAANYGTYIGIFGGEVTASYYFPAAAISALVTLLFILVNVKAEKGQPQCSLPGLLGGFFRGLAALFAGLFQSLGKKQNVSAPSSALLHKKPRVPAAALLAPMIPLAVVYLFKALLGFGKAENGMYVRPYVCIFPGQRMKKSWNICCIICYRHPISGWMWSAVTGGRLCGNLLNVC